MTARTRWLDFFLLGLGVWLIWIALFQWAGPEALSPPDRDDTDWEALGTSAEEVREFALGGLRRRLSIVGVPLETL